MAQRELSVRVGVNTGSASSQLKSLNVAIKQTQSEFKNAGSGIKNFENSMKGTSAKVKMLSETLDAQKKKMDVYKKQIKDTEKVLKESNTAYINQKKVVSDLQNKLDESKKTYGENSKEVKKLEKELSGAEKELRKQEKAVTSAENNLSRYKTELNKTEAEVKSLKAQLKDCGTAFGNFARKINDAGLKAIGGTLKGIGTGLKGVGATAIGVGGAITAGVTVPFNRLKKEAVQTGLEFEASMSKVRAISGASAEDMQKLEQVARKMGSETQKSAKDASDAMTYMAMAGYDVGQMTEMIRPMLDLAVASEADLARTSDLVTDSMSAMGMSTGEAVHYMDVLAKTSSSANTDASMMMEAYIGVGGVLKNLNIPLEESATYLGALANQGLKGSEAGNALSSILINLTSGAGQAGVAMKELGLNAYDQNGKFKGLNVVINELKEKTSKLTDAQRDQYLAMIGGKTNISTLNMLLNASGEEYDKLKAKVDNSSGAMSDMAVIMGDNLKGKIAIANSAFEELQLTMYDVFGGSNNLKATLVALVLNGFNKLPGPIKKVLLLLVNLIAILGPIIAILGALTVGIGFAVSALGSFVAGLVACTAPMLPIIGLVVLLIATFRRFGDEIKMVINGALDAMRPKFEELQQTFFNCWTSMKATWDEVANILMLTMKDVIWGVVNTVAGLWPSISDGFQLCFTIISDFWNAYAVPIFQIIQEVIGQCVQFIISILPGINNAFQICWGIVKAIYDSVVKPVMDGIMQVARIVVDWFRENWPKVSQVFNSVMQSLKGFWDSIGRPLFDIIKSIVTATINTAISIIQKLSPAFSAVWNLVSSIWNSVGKPVFDKIVQVVGWLMSKCAPHIERFGNIVSSVFGAIASPINFVIGLFEKIVNFGSKVVNTIGGVLDKINPFRSVDMNISGEVNTDNVDMAGYNRIALSGSYYNPKTRGAQDVSKFIQSANSMGRDMSSIEASVDANSLGTAISEAIQKALKDSLAVTVNAMIDGRQVAKATAGYMDSELNTINRRKARLGGQLG